MPQFHSNHAPGFNYADSDFNDFLEGYFDAAEWLWPEDGEDAFDRSKVRGWSAAAKRSMIADCRDFYRANKVDLAAYAEAADHGMSGAGHDFFLTREGHGAGFWDRGLGELGERLASAARSHGTAGYPYLVRGWVHL